MIDTYQDRDLVVKCSPGIDFDAVGRLGFDGEIEVTSYRGAVREACLWSAGLAQAGVRRRASVLDRDEQIIDTDPDDCQVRPAGRWIVDPDGAVVRAHLVAEVAASLDGALADPRIAYITADTARGTPFARRYEVLEVLPFAVKRVRAALRGHGIGTLTIKKRGFAADIERLRRDLRPSGDRDGVLVLTRVGDTPVALICRAAAPAATV